MNMELEEELKHTSTFSHTLSRQVCAGSYLDEVDCSWYHGAWQYLRLFDMVSAPTWHEDFYTGKLRESASCNENVDILISGTADYTILAIVFEALSEQKKKPNITVLDACRTPLILCEWYGIQSGLEISTSKKNILAIDNPTPEFDIIIADAFLTRFDESSKTNAIETWYGMLKPGGTVITTIRIEEEVEESIGSKSDEIKDFGERALKNAESMSEELYVSPEVIRQLSIRYAENIISYPVSSVDDARNLFQPHGFSEIDPDTHRVKGEMKETLYCHLFGRK